MQVKSKLFDENSLEMLNPHLLLGNICFSLGSYEDAKNSYEKCLEIAKLKIPDNAI